MHIVAKTASRNVAFKVAKMRGFRTYILRKPECDEFGSYVNVMRVILLIIEFM